MYTQVNNQVSYGGILPILNNNVIKEDKKKGYGHGCLSGKVFKMRTLLGK